MELLCPAGNLASLKATIDAGADAVYLGMKDDTNARHFFGLNFTPERLREGIRYAHQRNRKVYLAINTFATTSGWGKWQAAADQAANSGIDAVIASDIAVLDYLHQTHPNLPIHLSVQASATNVGAIAFYHEQFNIRRVVLPRVLSLHQVKQLAKASPVPVEVFGFGSLCIMAEGRCYLSSYMTGESPNNAGVCSPAKYVSWEDDPDGNLKSRLNNVLIDSFSKDESAGYPTLCKGRFEVGEDLYHVMEEPTSLNTMDILPELRDYGVASIKIEGRQRSPAYVKQATQIWRQAIDACLREKSPAIDPSMRQALSNLSEGSQTSLGALHKSWK